MKYILNFWNIIIMCGRVLMTENLSMLPSLEANNQCSQKVSSKFLDLLEKTDNSAIESLTTVNLDTLRNSDIQELFYKTVSRPLQTVCSVLKRVGGSWKGATEITWNGVAEITWDWDGKKFICLDHANDWKDGCLAYSFGIGDDWVFEDAMDDLGCDVYAYDHTVKFPSRRGKNIAFHRKGLADVPTIFRKEGKSYTEVDKIKKGEEESHFVGETLDHILKSNNHTSVKIDYLKIDVEGWELPSMAGWIDSGALDNVVQLGLEFHTMVPGHNGHDIRYKELVSWLQRMYHKGFRIISYDPNLAWGKKGSRKTYPLFDVLFMRVNDK